MLSLDTLYLEKVKRSNPIYQDIRSRHYVANHGTIGRQLHYLIHYEESIVGIISGASAVWRTKPRDQYFEINNDNRIKKIQTIVNNVVFRLERNIPNLGSAILGKWRREISKDWFERYGDKISGFETFIFGENRFGALYLADNWQLVGETNGSAKTKPNGCYSPGEYITTQIKRVYCKKVNKKGFRQRRAQQSKITNWFDSNIGLVSIRLYGMATPLKSV